MRETGQVALGERVGNAVRRGGVGTGRDARRGRVARARGPGACSLGRAPGVSSRLTLRSPGANEGGPEEAVRIAAKGRRWRPVEGSRSA